MHTLLANAAQPYELSNYPTFTAEVASTAHELLLANMMAERAKTKEEKLFYLGQIMENYRGTFFRQSMFAEFQLAINDLANKGEALSGEKMSALYLDLLKRYHGPKVRIEPVYGAEWMYIQHFYLRLLRLAICNLDHCRELLRPKGDARRQLPTATAISPCFAPAARTMATTCSRSGGLDMATAEPYRLIIANFSKVLDQAEALL